jgi:hypothetical protein
MKCEKCKKEITKENFWSHPHDDYTTIDNKKHYEETRK